MYSGDGRWAESDYVILMDSDIEEVFHLVDVHVANISLHVYYRGERVIRFAMRTQLMYIFIFRFTCGELMSGYETREK